MHPTHLNTQILDHHETVLYGTHHSVGGTLKPKKKTIVEPTQQRRDSFTHIIYQGIIPAQIVVESLEDIRLILMSMTYLIVPQVTVGH